ncbi:MAG: TetM/TetW/TetO/TetS family tetracycline resistance ribosomal protection protein [Clostridium sp.]|nr:TetM/TetW/TetO/TetS family tetracycline resistance ribosomal protection protein [Clostridium sp.]
MKKTIGILAHVDAGKTTFAEQILYHTKSIRKLGRVDHGNSFMDTSAVEKQRGITVFSDQAIFNYKGSTYYLIDTPGHADFSSEMERAISIMDYAVIVISASDGIQSQTEIIWELLKKHKIPVFFFINKTDRVGCNVQNVIESINSNFTKDTFLIDEAIDGNCNMSEELIEFTAERRESLLNRYFDSGYDKILWLDTLKELIKENKFYPCLSGSALKNIGIDNFIDKLHNLTYTSYDEKVEKDFKGIVYKIKHDESKNKLSYIKILSGSIKIKSEIKVSNTLEKINEIRMYNSNKFETVSEAYAGDVVALKGISLVKAGMAIGNLLSANNKFEITPTLKSKVIFSNSLNPKDVLNIFKILEEEDPALNVNWNEGLKEIQISILGKIQLEVLKEIILQRFNLKVDFGPCKILYKETIKNSVLGAGHFEPLRHYAEVHLKIEPAKRNSGIHFTNKCSNDDLSVGNQNLVRTHIFERTHHGILTGSPITDLNITLLTGRSHVKHTCGGDFRQATYRALSQGLEKAQNLLLEPYYKFRIKIHNEYLGRVLSDIKKFSGNFNPPELVNENYIITGSAPYETIMDYPSNISAFTKGTGSIMLIFKGYYECHNSSEVIEKIGYNRNSDIENTSSSVFCSKGQPFVVPGNKSDEFMHVQIEL